MKKYIKPTVKVKEVEMESAMLDTSTQLVISDKSTEIVHTNFDLFPTEESENDPVGSTRYNIWDTEDFTPTTDGASDK